MKYIHYIYSALQNQIRCGFKFPILLVIGIFFWFTPFVFFWRDEWVFMMQYNLGKTGIITGDFVADVKPLFNPVMFLQFFLFKNSLWLYHIVSILFHVCLAFFVQKFLRKFLTETYNVFISVITLIVLLHPVNFMNVFWIANQCESVHLFTTLLYFIFAFSFISNPDLFSFFGTLIAGLIMNFIFPNGIFISCLPVLFVFYLKKPFKTILLSLVFIGAVLGAYLSFYFYLAGQHELYTQEQVGIIPLLIHNMREVITHNMNMISSTFLRIILIIARLYPPLILKIVFFIFLFVSGYVWYKRTDRRFLLFFLWAWLFAGSLTVSIFRYDKPEIIYYYSSLIFVPALLIWVIILEHFLKNRLFTKKNVTVYLIGCVVFLNYGKYIFSRRNIANKQFIAGTSINHDEPMSVDSMIYYKGLYNQPAIHLIYEDFKNKK